MPDGNVVTLGVIVRAVRVIPDHDRDLAARIRAGSITIKDIEDLYSKSSAFADWFDMIGQKVWKRSVTASSE
ncbi:MAG: hypothetical protein ACKO0Z_15100 [Betaproteobacteria bacterium]